MPDISPEHPRARGSRGRRPNGGGLGASGALAILVTRWDVERRAPCTRDWWSHVDQVAAGVARRRSPASGVGGSQGIDEDVTPTSRTPTEALPPLDCGLEIADADRSGAKASGQADLCCPTIRLLTAAPICCTSDKKLTEPRSGNARCVHVHHKRNRYVSKGHDAQCER
jgi:hypothetical protein